MTVMRSAQIYFGIVFAAGFVLGTVRIFFLAPVTGDLTAVLLEMPIILAMSWWAAGIATRKQPHLATPSARLRIGAIAFLGLMVAEASLAIALGVVVPSTTATCAVQLIAVGRSHCLEQV